MISSQSIFFFSIIASTPLALEQVFRRYQLFCSMSFVIHQKEKQKSLTSLRTSDFSSNLIVRVLALYNVKNVTCSLSYFMKSLNPTIPVLHIGVFRRFCAIACVCIGASPNKVICYFSIQYEWYPSSNKDTTNSLLFLFFFNFS